MKTTQCRLCEASLPAPIMGLPDTPLANEFTKTKEYQERLPLKLVSCNNCHHYQLNYSVEADRLFNKDYVFVTGTSEINVKYFTEYAKDVVTRLNLKPGDFVVEIASNDGTLLKAFKNLGMRVLGIDPAEAIAMKASKSGIETLPYFFTEKLSKKIKEEYGSPKLICANNVLAHLDNVIDIVKGVKNLLTEDGTFIFENSYFKDMYVNNIPDLIYHEHMSHFLVYPLQVLFQSHGMFFYDVQPRDVHGGSIRGYVRMKPFWAPQQVSSVDDFIKIERELGLIGQGDKNIKMASWKERINKLSGKLWSTINQYAEDGKKVVAYGAPSKFTTLSYMLDLDTENIAYVVDDNPLKQGTFSPGKHIPVVDSSELKKINLM